MEFKYIRIDPHLHFRDGKQAHEETIAHGMQVAEQQGVQKVCDMPNTDPPITDEILLNERLKLVPEEREGDYFIYMGVTSDPEQIEAIVECNQNYNEVCGLKMFAGRSVGSLAVISLEDQRTVYQTLAKHGYTGVLAVHCEKEEFINQEWDPTNPYSHALARPKKAEIMSVIDQINLAKKTGFQGTLHICHASLPETVDLVNMAKEEINITCGVTPHHIIWDSFMLSRQDGLLYKMNPPLRKKEEVIALRTYLTEGKIDWIETDHAPHALGEKLYPPYWSGYPSLYMYRHFVEEFLPDMGVSQELIRQMTYDNIQKTFGNKF